MADNETIHTGSTVIAEEVGLSLDRATLADLGRTKRIEVGRAKLARVEDALHATKVTRTALQNAASVDGLMLTTDCMVADLPEDKKGGGGPDMGVG